MCVFLKPLPYDKGAQNYEKHYIIEHRNEWLKSEWNGELILCIKKGLEDSWEKGSSHPLYIVYYVLCYLC